MRFRVLSVYVLDTLKRWWKSG